MKCNFSWIKGKNEKKGCIEVRFSCNFGDEEEGIT